MTAARPEELSYDLAYSAYRNTGHTPEDAARRDQQAYADDVNGLHEEMLKLAATDGQKALLTEEIERYRKGYLKHYGAYLHSHSRCASSFITGPANFPVHQQQKRSQAADNKLREFLDWRTRAQAAIRDKLLEARTPEAKDEDAWQALAKDIGSSLKTIEQIDAGEMRGWNRALFANSISGKIERLANNGEFSLVTRAIALLAEYYRDHEKPCFTARHKVWGFLDLARQKAEARDAALTEEPTTLVEVEGIRIVANKAEDRVQIFFPDKPDEEMREKLKGEGWHLSREKEAWQRKLTNAAIYSAKKLLRLG